MRTSLCFFFLLLHHLFSSPCLGAAAADRNNVIPAKCIPTASCGNFTFGYPFWLNPTTSGSEHVSYCGYPGFGVQCGSDPDTGILSVGSHSYTITRIHNFNNTVGSVYLRDTDIDFRCPQVRYSLIVSPGGFWTWFLQPPLNSTLTFLYNCTSAVADNASTILTEAAKIKCLSDTRSGMYSYVLPYGEDVPAGSCKATAVVPVLDDDPLWREMAGNSSFQLGSRYGEMLARGFRLRWVQNQGGCQACENSGGWCAVHYKKDNNVMFGCICKDQLFSTDICTHDAGGSEQRWKIIVISSAGSISTACLFLAFLLYRVKYLKRSQDLKIIQDLLAKCGTAHPKMYKYSEVKRITKHFSVKLGRGGCGTVYKGHLSDGLPVAVKMLLVDKKDDDMEDFINEVASISRTSHVNVVTLLGFCLEGTKRALIYEFMPNGSLEKFIVTDKFNAERDLPCQKLYEIVVGVARGLEYLHRGCNTRIVHFDIKPHNILLDTDFSPKISDFGMAKLCPQQTESMFSIGIARGTIGYIAPEVISRRFGTAGSKSDVYSYGMMVLEMVGARKRKFKNTDAATNSSSSTEIYFPRWIYENLDLYCLEACNEIDEAKLVRRMIITALWCIQSAPEDRPSMSRVVEMLESKSSLLEVPTQF